MTEQTAAAYTAEQIRLTLDKLHQSWDWLVELVEPGHATSAPLPAITDDQAERLEALGHSDRAYRAWNLRHGMSALPPSPAAARIAIIDAQALVADQVGNAVALLARAIDARYVGALPGLNDSMQAAMGWLGGAALDDVRNASVAAAIDKVLQRADRFARIAARCVDDDVEPLRERCPACGRRSLQRELPINGDRLIRCVSRSCRCTGDGDSESEACGCCQKSKRPGLAHVWTRDQEDGPDGLWASIAARPPRRVQPRRGAVGHGGWQSRGMAGQR